MLDEETKSSKEETFSELKRKIKELEDEVEVKDKVIDKFKERDSGWLITTPNPLYNGTTAGVLFTNGVAFIPKDAIIERYVVTLPAPNLLANFP